MKKFTFAAIGLAAVCLSFNVQSAQADVLEDAGLTPILALGDDAYGFHVFQMDETSIATLQQNGKEVVDYRLDNSARNFWWWNPDAWATWDDGYPGPDFHTEGYISLVTTAAASSTGWSGGGLNQGIVDGVGADFSKINPETSHLHFAYRSTNATSVGITLFDGENECGSVGANVSLGSEAFDGGPLVGDFEASGDWYAVDLSFADIKKLVPSFDFKNIENWNGNYFCMLTGAVEGKTLGLDHIYVYTPKADWNDESAVKTIGMEESNLAINGKDVVANGQICVYSISGSQVACGMNNVNLSEAGVYIVKAGNTVKKVVVK